MQEFFFMVSLAHIFFPWQLFKKLFKKKSQKLSSVRRAMQQKWVHILKRGFVRQTPFFYLVLLSFGYVFSSSAIKNLCPLRKKKKKKNIKKR